jgi:hypothetical protein
LSALPPIANIDIIGNVRGGYANVGNVIATFGNIGNVRMARGDMSISGQVNVLGNVAAGYFIGNGALLTGLTPFSLPAIANIDINGNVNGAYANVGNVIATFGNVGGVLISGGNVSVSGQVTALGNVSAGYFIGNGALLTGLVASQLPPVANIDINGNVNGAYVNVNTVIATLGNIGNVGIAGGNVDTPGQVTVLGNVSAEYFVGNGALLDGLVATKLPPIASIDIVGNVIGAYANVDNIIALNGNIGNIIMIKSQISRILKDIQYNFKFTYFKIDYLTAIKNYLTKRF